MRIIARSFLSFVLLASGYGLQNKPAQDPLVGDWRGESICVVRESACHDEDSLYHLSALPEKPGWFSMKGDKIVAGKPVTMGTMECSYDPAKHLLVCDFERGTLNFNVQDGMMEGTMTLKDKTLWRKIKLQKQELRRSVNLVIDAISQ